MYHSLYTPDLIGLHDSPTQGKECHGEGRGEAETQDEARGHRRSKGERRRVHAGANYKTILKISIFLIM